MDVLDEDNRRPAAAAPEAEAGAEAAEQHGALIVAGGAAVPSGAAREKRIVIVTQAVGEKAAEAKYAGKADIYLGYAPSPVPEGDVRKAVFGETPATARVQLLGLDLGQFGFSGLSRKRGQVSVGPSHPVYAAVNLAYQEGARDVKIVGLRPEEVTLLRPWFNEIEAEFTKLDFGG